ncbi:hypothetical protein QZM64_41545 [Burkholderia cepacia]|uniref:hypothetical protein n=1 Tax=Burkholderia cepacia TaxID=292 RepID=UPI000AE2E6D5|nr:hypothetical protein [Burkholderia cepacia]MDN7445652.1 hypothetical protein [Burkholderia cepacia]
MNMRWVSGGIALLVSAHAVAGLFGSDGSTYEECMEARRSEVKNTAQYTIAADYCRQKHPLPKLVDPFDPATAVPEDPVELHTISGLDPANAIARPAIAALALTHVSVAHDGQQYGGVRSPDFRWFTRADITNRNRFPLTAILLGVTQRGTKRCDWSARQYTEVYQCHGYAGSGMSGSFRCDIPDSENRRNADYCVVGLGITSSRADLNRYLPGK